MLPFTGLHNVRDVGGLPAAGGRLVRTGVLYRGDSPHEASPADIEYLLGTVGLATVIDLRSEREFEADGTNPLIPQSVEHHHFPIAGGPGGAIEGAPSGERLAARYLEYLDKDTTSVVAAVRAVAEVREGATIVHCRVGKDRTGVVIALILDTLGVAAEDIAHDYELTTEPMKRLLARLRDSPTYSANVSRLPDEMYSSEARTMVAFLEQLHARHGGAASWLLGHGLPQQSLQELHAHLLGADPAPVEKKESNA